MTIDEKPRTDEMLEKDWQHLYAGWPGAVPVPARLRPGYRGDYELDEWGEPHYLSVPPQSVMGGWLLGGRVVNPEWAGNVALGEN